MAIVLWLWLWVSLLLPLLLLLLVLLLLLLKSIGNCSSCNSSSGSSSVSSHVRLSAPGVDLCLWAGHLRFTHSARRFCSSALRFAGSAVDAERAFLRLVSLPRRLSRNKGKVCACYSTEPCYQPTHWPLHPAPTSLLPVHPCPNHDNIHATNPSIDHHIHAATMTTSMLPAHPCSKNNDNFRATSPPIGHRLSQNEGKRVDVV